MQNKKKYILCKIDLVYLKRLEINLVSLFVHVSFKK